ncbi:MAG: deoxynucleoside kinase [Anaerolineaceae bacterium]|nr:deoxynucleoside kinase [Anaerolineaceae bacterium]
MNKKFITIAGNIGVGKSTLVELLCKKMGWQPFYEPVTENPYLADFYENMEEWSFHSQVFFLAHRLLIHKQLVQSPESGIQDRSIYEDAEIFAHNLFLQGKMKQIDYETYRSLYDSLVALLPAPDLLIYLKASVPTVEDRIRKRSRTYEISISSDYLSQINLLYDQWINNFTLCPVLTIPADDLDFVAQPAHLQLIKSKIQDKLTGKDEVIF